MLCRFENRLTQQALVLEDYQGQATVTHAAELANFYAAIRRAQSKGWWTALALDYEAGWLFIDPPSGLPHPTQPVMRALFFAQPHMGSPWGAPTSAATLRAQLSTSKSAYLATLARIREDLHQGEYYQVNYTVELAVQACASPEHIYRQIANQHPTAYAVYLDDGQRQIASFSPELFVQHQDQRLRVKPMKGTRPRFLDPASDQASAQALRQSAKDCAENIMIVDLLRNDLGQLATPGSVQPHALLEVEQYPSVWTMTSTIEAHCAQASLEQVLPALFPCGSITGAPKRAAMHALHQYEQRARGIYCGSLGWLAPNGDFELNVTIRTLEFNEAGQARFGVGGGIVYDSDPEQEWEEIFWKARLLGCPIEYQPASS